METFTIENLLALRTRLSAECHDHFDKVMEEKRKAYELIDELMTINKLTKEIAEYAKLGLEVKCQKKVAAFESKRVKELGRKCLFELVN